MDENTTGAVAAAAASVGVGVSVGARRGFHDVYDAHDNNDDEKHKRRRLTYHAGDDAHEPSSSLSSSTVPSTSFLGFHLELLKSLYVQKVENDNDIDNPSRNCAVASTLSSQQQQQVETKEKWDDSPIDPSIWKMAESFLIQRSSLAKNKQEATRLQGIHQETIVFMEEGESRLAFHKKNSTGVSTTDATVSPVQQQYRRLHSPILSNVSQYASPTNRAKSTARSTSFGIVSRLLQRRSKSANKAYQKQIHPFQPLLQQTCQLEKKLQDMLKGHKDARLAKDQAATNELLASAIMPSQLSQHQSTVLSGVKNDSLPSTSEDERCRLVRLQTKLKLWSLLVQDLNCEIS
jgi:hypothetical protein